MRQLRNHLAKSAESVDVSDFGQASALLLFAFSTFRNVHERADGSSGTSVGVDERYGIFQQVHHASVFVNYIDFEVADFFAFSSGNLHGQLMVRYQLALKINADKVVRAIVAVRRFRGILRRAQA